MSIHKNASKYVLVNYLPSKSNIIDKILHLKKITLKYHIICSTACGKSLLKI